MITMVPEIIFSLIISIFGTPITSGDPTDDQGHIKDFIEEPDRQAFSRPAEALGGGYKKE
jgi:hypothetical protein